MIFLAGIMGWMFPAGRDPLVAQSGSLAMRGKNLYLLLKHFEEQNPDFLRSFSNTSELMQFLKKAWPDCELTNDCWNIAVQIPEGANENFPMLISANLDPRGLEEGCGDKVLMLGRESGAPCSLLQDKKLVVVRRNGMTEIMQAKYCTRIRILGEFENYGKVTYLNPCGTLKMTIPQLEAQ